MVAEQRPLPAAERMPGHGHRDRHVDADHADLDLASERACHAAVGREAGHAVAEFMGVDEFHRRREIRHAHDAQHRSEDFFAVDVHGRLDVVEQRAAQEEALFVARHRQAAAVDQHVGAGGNAVLDVADDLVAVLGGDQRAHFGVAVHAVLDHQGLDARDQAFDYLVGHVAHRHGHRDGHAAFAGRAVGRAHQGVGDLIQVGIGHHHQVVLGAAQGLHALAAAGAFGVDVFGDGGRADEGQGLDVRVRDQCVHGLLVAMHHVEDAGGQAGFGQQFGQAQRGRRVAFGRLEHEGVAAGDGHREHPARHHHGEVERRDAGHHAQGLAHAPVVDAAADLVGILALEQLRNAAGEFHDLDAAHHFALGVREHLAVFAGDQLGQLVLVLVEQRLEVEQHARTLERGRLGPGREGGLGRGHGQRHFVGGRQRNRGGHFAGGRIEAVGVAVAAAVVVLAVDVVGNLLHGKGSERVL